MNCLKTFISGYYAFLFKVSFEICFNSKLIKRIGHFPNLIITFVLWNMIK